MANRFSSPKDSFFAECEGTESEGAALVELADRLVAERSRFGPPVLHEMLEQSGATEALALPAGRLATPAEIFDAFASPQRTALREQLEQSFEIVALPRTPLEREIQEGDVMVRRGDGAMGHISVIASGELFDRQSLSAHGLTPESASEGRFVQVVETGARPHTLADNFSRRVTGLTEAMPADTMVLRMRKPASEAIWQGLSEGGASSLLRDIVILRLATPPPTTPTVVNVTAPAATPSGGDSEDIACEYLDPSGLSWPEASPEQADFMRRVYVNQVNRACQTRSFAGDVPDAALGQIEGSERAVRAAADQCRAMLAAARAAMSTDPAAVGVTISVISGYRSASRQLHNWNRNFPRYFQETQSDRAGSLGGELGAAAAALLASYISRRLAAPGFSLHNNGLAVDLGTVQNGRSMGADTHDANRRNWRASWFFRWLTQNAARFNFYQNTSIDEPWHWEFRGPVTSESEGEAESNQEAFVCEGELEEAESWTGSDEQTEFREKVLDEHIARTRRRKGPPQRDLTRSELKTVEGTTVEMRTDAAEAASELLAAANHDLETTTLSGSDSDAAVTIRISVASGYRSADRQRRVWREHFSGYYNQTRAARESLPGGAHSAAAVTYMLETFKIPNRVAAPGYSNHQGGIAIDFQQVRAKGHEISNSYEASAQRKWRASWFFQWLQQNAQSWKFKPYEKEAWHWEYKPVLEKTSNQPSGRSLSLAEASARTESVPDGPVSARDLLGGFLWRFTSNTLSGLKVAAFCTKSGSAAQDVDVLLYAHGLIHPCPPIPRQPEDLIVSHPFKLGEKLDASNRAMVLVVPFLNWEHLAGDFAFGPRNRWHGLAKPKNVNALVEEVLTGLGQVKSARPPGLRSLLIAGHSRAYDFLDPLAHAYADPLMRQGALAKLSQVWAFDTSYSCPVEDWKHWIDSNPGLHVSIIFRKDSKTSTCGGRFRMGLGGTSRVSIVELNPHITHCEVPGEMLPRLLGSSAPDVQAEYEAEEQFDRDSADLAADSESAFEGELGEGRIEDSDTETFELSVEGESEREIESKREIILVAGTNYPHYRQSGSVWKESRALSPGTWRQYCLTLAAYRLNADPKLKVTLFDFFAGTQEAVTLDSKQRPVTSTTHQFVPPHVEDYLNLTGIDLAKPNLADLVKARIEIAKKTMPKKPQVHLFDGAHSLLKGGSAALMDFVKSANSVASPVISVTDVYQYIDGLAGSLLELHFFAHAFNVASSLYSGGPILLNTLDNPVDQDRFVLDKDCRSAKDFRKPTIDPKNFAQAFASDAKSYVWGCNFQRGFVRQFVHQVGRQRDALAKGKTINISFDTDWGTQDEFRDRLGLNPTVSVRNVVVDLAKVEQVMKNVNQATYMQKLATASGHPVVGGAPGTYADDDGGSSPLKLLHVPMTKDPFADPTTPDTFENVLEFFRDHLQFSFDTMFGDHKGLGRGYMIFNP